MHDFAHLDNAMITVRSVPETLRAKERLPTWYQLHIRLRRELVYLAVAVAVAGCGGADEASGLGLVGKPARLAFEVQPTDVVAGASQSISVRVEDATGNLVPGAQNAVNLSLVSDEPGVQVTGHTSVSTIRGVARFDGLTIKRAGSGYVFTATTEGRPLSPATSTAFDVAPADPKGLRFVEQPGIVKAGSPFGAKLEIVDAFGNRVIRNGIVAQLALSSAPAGGFLNGTHNDISTSGRLSFDGLVIKKAGTGYRLAAIADGLEPATTDAFKVIPGPVARRWMDPGAAVLSFPIGDIDVRIKPHVVDAYDNPIELPLQWSSTNTSVATVDQTGYVSGHAAGTTEIHASTTSFDLVAYITVFCSPERCGSTGRASLTTPTSVPAGATLPPVTYSQSAFGTCSSQPVTVRLGNNPTGAQLSGNTELRPLCPPSSVTWSELTIDRPGTYSLVAGRAESAPFVITPSGSSP